MMLETSLVYYIGQNNIIKTLVAKNGGEVVGIIDGDDVKLWLLDGGEIPVPKKDIKILSAQKMDDGDLDWYWNNLPKIELHRIRRYGLPDQKLVEWGENRTWNWLSRHHKESGFTYQEARSIFLFCKYMKEIYPEWSPDNIRLCWKKAGNYE